MNKFNEMLKRYELPFATFGLEDDLPQQGEAPLHVTPGGKLPDLTESSCAPEEKSADSADEAILEYFRF